MGNFLADAVMDGVTAVLQTADLQVMCEDAPASYAEATTDKGSGGKALGEIAVTSGNFSSANGDVSGRKTSIVEKTPVTVDVTGVFDHAALVDDGGSVLLAVSPLAHVPITAVNQGTKTFTVTGDVSAICVAGKVVSVRGSTGNDGIYVVASSSYGAPSTAVVVQEAIPNATGDGNMIHGAQSVTAGNTCTINAHDVCERTDPAPW